MGAAFAATFIYYAFDARFQVPYIDDWTFLSSLFEPHPFTSGLWQLHNEHIIVLPRLLLWMDVWLWGWPGYATLGAALVGHVVIAGVLIAACRDCRPEERRLLAGSVLVLSFLTYTLQGAVFAGAALFPLVAAFTVLSIACVARCAQNGDPRSVVRWASLAAVMCVLAMLCLTNGLIVPFILMALAIMLRLAWPIPIGFAALGLAGVMVRYAAGQVPASVFVASPAGVIRFRLAMLAGPFASLSPAIAVWIGAGISALSAVVLWQFVRARVRTATSCLVVGNLAFVFASFGMAALARTQFGLSVAAESRYVDLAMLAWASLLVAGLPLLASARLSGRIASVALPTLGVIALPLQVLVGEVWSAKAHHLDTAAMALAAGVDDEDWIWRIDPLGTARIAPVLPHLRARGVEFLAFPDRGEQLPASSEAPACDGSMVAIQPEVDVSAGLRVQGHIRNLGTALRIVDGDRRVRGLARRAPIARSARAGANDFVSAEIDVLSGRLKTEGEWLGFSAWGAGPPFRAQLLNANSQPVCEAPVPCCTAPPPEPSRPELVVRGGLPEGVLDHAGCSVVAGWAWDGLRPDEPVDVQVTISNGLGLTVTASEFRPDLLEHKKGNGRHAFLLRAPAVSLSAGTWRVDASFADSGVPLTGSPRIVVCPQP